jgi:TetR/AcrR family transcriptional regulator
MVLIGSMVHLQGAELYAAFAVAHRFQRVYYLTNWLINAMVSTAPKSRLGSRGRPEKSRAAILQAAIREFAQEGMAGARTDAIARAARVNKALLYYYFKDKETLYGEAIDFAFGQLSAHMMEVLEQRLPPREKVLSYVATYFDFVAGHDSIRNLIQMETMRAGHGSPHLQRVAKRYFLPLFSRLSVVIREGITSGEFRDVDPVHFIPSMIALVVFYFISAPVMKTVIGFDPLSPEMLAERRAAVIDFISAALLENHERRRKGGSK